MKRSSVGRLALVALVLIFWLVVAMVAMPDVSPMRFIMFGFLS